MFVGRDIGWSCVPYTAVQDWPTLRIPPLGVVPQRDRRPRLIVDYTYSGLNEETLPLAPREAMQFGRALQHVCSNIVYAPPQYGPVSMSNIDITDGFYRVWVQIDDIPKLGVAIPTASGFPLVASPLALPMGWVESPPYFTAFTDTACDLANSRLRADPRTDQRLTTRHRLEETVAAIPLSDHDTPHRPATTRATEAVRLSPGKRRPVASADVYVDDFLLLAQTQHERRRVMRAVLHSIDDVFWPLEKEDPPACKEPAYVKKMLNGDACWSTQKRMLGWDIDSEAVTLVLPPHRIQRLREVLAWIQPPRKRLAVAKWHQLLGELRSMSRPYRERAACFPSFSRR